jgi:hypothetical protein
MINTGNKISIIFRSKQKPFSLIEKNGITKRELYSCNTILTSEVVSGNKYHIKVYIMVLSIFK